MAATDYTLPVSQFLTLGEPDPHNTDSNQWRNYLELGFGSENIPDLIRLATDLEIYDNWDDEDETSMIEYWGPLHAWRTLAQLKAEEAIEPLLPLFKAREDDDWAGEELPAVYGMIGPKAIPALTKYLADNNKVYWLPIQASASLREIAIRHPESRSEVVAILSKQLEKASENHPTGNGFIIADLLDLKAVEALPAIEKAFKTNNVDESIAGDYDDVLVAFGLKSKATLEKEREAVARAAIRDTPQEDNYLPPVVGVVRQKTKAEKEKAKAKRKMAAASRKKNRKR